ncbi:MAG: exodeoxyribonuclease VII small subunit [Lachnospiraceae bacterium]|nr:exodeoxyribonuclease VII small subunit [Lachnospiraceae bacterium]
MAKEEKKDVFNVDEAMDRLDEINEALAEGELSLNESLELYKEGVKLAAECKNNLEGVEKELKILNGEEP